MQYPSNWAVYEKDHYPDHPKEQWSQVVGFQSPHKIDTRSDVENVAIYVRSLPSKDKSPDLYFA